VAVASLLVFASALLATTWQAPAGCRCTDGSPHHEGPRRLTRTGGLAGIAEAGRLDAPLAHIQDNRL